MTKDEMKDELKNKISMALKDPVLQQGFEIICKNTAELEKENAELKEQCLILADCDICNSTCKTENIEMKKQLTKAKEIIEKLFNAFASNDFFKEEELLAMAEAEQFLKESE